MMAKRKIDARKVPTRQLKKLSSLQQSIDLHCSQNEEEICEIGWDSPKPLSGRHTETTVADIVAQLSASVAMPVFSPPLQLHYISPQTSVNIETTPSKAPLCGRRREPRAKQLSFNQAIIQKVMAVINDYKPSGEVSSMAACTDEKLQNDQEHFDKPMMRDQSTGVTPVNQSSEELWTDEDDSFINATQAFLDTAFPDQATDSRSVITSTPNLRPRNTRLTFRLDQPATMLAPPQQNTIAKEGRQSSLRSANSSPMLKKACVKQVPSTKGKVHRTADAGKLLESDEILAGQIAFLTDVDLSKPNCNDHAVNKHESFSTDNDTLESAELAAVVEEVESEYLASQRLSASVQTAGKTSSVQRFSSVSALPSKAIATSISSSVPVTCKPSTTKSVLPAVSTHARMSVSAPINSLSGEMRKNLGNGNRCTNIVKPPTVASSSLGKKMYSTDEIERKRQEALQKRRSKALANSNR